MYFHHFYSTLYFVVGVLASAFKEKKKRREKERGREGERRRKEEQEREGGRKKKGKKERIKEKGNFVYRKKKCLH